MEEDFLNEKGAKDPVQQRILGMKLARPEMYLEASYSRSLQMEGRWVEYDTSVGPLSTLLSSSKPFEDCLLNTKMLILH